MHVPRAEVDDDLAPDPTDSTRIRSVERHYLKELMINSGIADLRFEIVQVKARIAAHSGTIFKIRNADLDDFDRQAACHELIKGSSSYG